jgi:putative transposase
VTDVTEDRDQAGAELSAADEQVLRELTERARAGGLKLSGPGGLLGKLTKMVIEGALEGELDDHLGYARRLAADGDDQDLPGVRSSEYVRSSLRWPRCPLSAKVGSICRLALPSG